MEAELQRVWIRLSFRSYQGVLLIDATSSLGESITSDADDQVVTPARSVVTVRADVAKIREIFSQAFERLHGPDRKRVKREGATRTTPIPVFVDLPEAVDWVDWIQITKRLYPVREDFVFVEANGPAPEPSQFSLPLKMLIVGQRAPEILGVLNESSSWFRDATDLVEYSAVRHWPTYSDPHVPFDIAIMGSDITRPRGMVPRLAIIVGDRSQVPGFGAVRPPFPLGSNSVLVVPSVAAANEFLEHLTHDLPLHEALHELRSDEAVLCSSHTAVHDFRMRDLATRIALDMYDFETSPELAVTRQLGYPELASVVDPDFHDDELMELVEQETRDLLADYVFDDAASAAVLTDRLTFDRERNGLLPAWELQRQLSEIRARSRPIVIGSQSQFPSQQRPDDARRDSDAEADNRVVDISVRRHPATPGLTGDPFVQPGTHLARDSSYFIRVRIGDRSRFSIVAGDVRPIAGLLPKSEGGHELEMVLFLGDFIGESTTRITTHLPENASSTPVEFAVRTPPDPGVASARVGVYYQNNLVQTFSFLASIAAQETEGLTEDGPIALEDHTLTFDWDNLEQLGPRHLSLVVNDIAGTHRLHVLEPDTEPLDWKLGEKLQENLAEPIRTTLKETIGARGKKEALRTLVAAGRKLWLGLFLQQDETLPPTFTRLRERRDRVIQVVRADVHQAVPWALIYDWDAPSPGAPTCWGVDGTGAPCTHTRTDDVACVQGFWGVRHYIEEIIQSDHEPVLEVPLGPPPLRLDMARGVKNPYTDGLRDELGQQDERGNALAVVNDLTTEDSLLDQLWANDRAPLQFIVGHYNKKLEAIESGTAESQVSWMDIAERLINNQRQFPAPQPLIALIACDTGAVVPSQVGSHVQAFTKCGAAGLVATECIILSSHARAFGLAFVKAVAAIAAAHSSGVEPARPPMADAVRRARLDMLSHQRLAALAFVAFGPATVRLTVDDQPRE